MQRHHHWFGRGISIDGVQGLSGRRLPASHDIEQASSTHFVQPAGGGFVGLMALLMAWVACSIDIMLPALLEIGRDLGAGDENSAQLIISSLFLGLALGQMIYGPFSDRFGRKPVILAGLLLFILGALLSLAATSFPAMLLGRFLQGLGIAAPRVVSIAMVRDLYKGDAMARITSLILTVFVLVPLLAPTLGQGILLIGHWRLLFLALLAVGAIAAAWLWFLQQETLDPANRRPLSFASIAGAAIETLRHPIALGYAVAAGLVFGGFLGYLNSATQILQIQYDLGLLFPFYFSVVAFGLGAATILNARLVMRLGMRRLCHYALISLVVTSITFTAITLMQAGHPPLWALMTYLMVTFFSIGVMLGNFNALAMEPLGHIAGIAAGVIGTLTTLISILLGVTIGQAYDGTLIPMALSFSGLGLLSLAVVLWTERHR